MNKFIQFLQRIFQGSAAESDQASAVQSNGSAADEPVELLTNDESLISLMQLLEHTKEGEYSCEETLDLLDEYVELAVDNQDLAAVMPLVKNHISDCPDCTERFEALVQILQNS